MSETLLSVDPGREKCGLALLDPSGAVVRRAIVPAAELRAAVEKWCADGPRPDRILIGDGTGLKAARALLPPDFYVPVEIVPEKNTTLRARARYFRENPPPWFLRWIPISMRVPPVPVDDWAAVLIAEDYRAGKGI